MQAVTLAEVPTLVGRRLGHTDWREMTQERVDKFADVTEDHNYIHVDVERAKASQFGGTIAHGYLTVSLLAPISQQLLEVTEVSEIKGGIQAKVLLAVEVKGAERPAVIADCLFRYYA